MSERRFIEHPDRRELNNDLAGRVKIAPADLADGTSGVLVVLGRSFVVFTLDQAEALRANIHRVTSINEPGEIK